MKDAQKFRTQKLLLLLAILSFLGAVAEGCLYYADQPFFFRILLILQNGINAFAFKPSISISDAINLMTAHSTPVYTVVSYIYGAAVFTAPYCTVAMIYKVLERLMHMVVTLRWQKRGEHIVIFGYNSDISAMLKNYDSAAHKKQYIHIISDYSFDSEERYALTKQGHRIHSIKVFSMEQKDLYARLKKAYVDHADHIILFEENAVSNFSLLQIFSLRQDDGGFALKQGAKITCRCEDSSIAELIAEHYRPGADGNYGYDLELVSIPELQVRRMFSEHPLHTFYAGSDVPLSAWHMHILIIGFGMIGEQTLLQAMNLGVVHRNNRIVIDIYDTDIDRKTDIFVNRFHNDSFEIGGRTIRLRKETADGELLIRCHADDVRTNSFFEGIRAAHTEMPFTYAVAAIDDMSIAVHCAKRLSQFFSENGGKHTPILLRMDTDRRIAEYMSSNNGPFSEVGIIESRPAVLTLENILNREVNAMAKQFHQLYSGIQIVSKGETVRDTGSRTANAHRNDASLFKRESSKALASHSSVKQVIMEQLVRELSLPGIEDAIRERIGTDGSLMTYDGKIWHLREDEDAFLRTLSADAFACTIAQMEHRRWCCFVASVGWRCGKPRDDARKVHDCLVPFDALCADEKGRTTVKYDLMAMMQCYLSFAGQGSAPTDAS